MRIINTALISLFIFSASISTAWSQSAALDWLTKEALTSLMVEKEGLSAPMPPGFKIADQRIQTDLDFVTYVPVAESATEWLTLVSVFKGGRPMHIPLEQFDSGVQSKMATYCATPEIRKLGEGKENGFDYTEWFIACAINSKTNRPEFMITKTIKGDYSFIAVNYVFQKLPTDALISEATTYLKTVKSCDPAKPAADCPVAQ